METDLLVLEAPPMEAVSATDVPPPPRLDLLSLLLSAILDPTFEDYSDWSYTDESATDSATLEWLPVLGMLLLSGTTLFLGLKGWLALILGLEGSLSLLVY
jgi:hypothetical protein